MVTSVVFLTLKLAAERVGADSAGQVHPEYVTFLTFRGKSAFPSVSALRPAVPCLYPRALVLLFFFPRSRVLSLFTPVEISDGFSAAASRRETNAERGRAPIGASRAVGEHVLRFIAEEKSHSFSTLARSRYEQSQMSLLGAQPFHTPTSQFHF